MSNKTFSKLHNYVDGLNHKPSMSVLLLGSVISFLLMGFANSILEASYSKSQFPVPFMIGQTAFNGELLKSYFQVLLEKGTIGVFIQTQFIDFLFIFSVILLGFFAWVFIARLHGKGTFFRKAGLWFSFSLPLAGVSDAVENIFSFFLLAAPLTFPNWLAIPYSTIAVIKFAFWTVGLIWLTVSILALILKFIIGLFKQE